jgi:pantetheine-phosphate adenylyltransferase
MPRIAIFPGSFDPFTKGHEDIVRRSLPLFDELIIAIGNNSSKQRYF